ncbi:uncharacterized protein [Bombus flavifrons]|uniref:uncharacterized protein n=1 Tax=Bombus flavifrons TaxID=103934 RepID=UPI00370492A6
MKMYCCVRGTFHCQYINGVQFNKLKTKYRTDEDIVVCYTIQDRIHTSTRDWIGIFPRGWSNLQQYLTFEYIILSPKTATLTNRSIMFLHTFHREALPNVDYQFVYVSKEIEILGTSSYFRFIVIPNLRAIDRNSNTSDRGVDNVHDAHDGHPPLIVSPTTSNVGKILRSSKSIDNFLESHRTCRSFAEHSQRTCRFCSKSVSFTTNRVQFLMLHNEQLVARMGRLTRDLELTEAAVKSEKMAQAVLTRRLQAYETFVADMFKCLNLRGTVRILDKTGQEIIVQKVKPKNLPLMRDETGDKPVPILEVSMLNQSSELKECNDGSTTNINEMEKVPRVLNLCETEDNEERVTLKYFKDDGFSVKKELNENEKNFEITLSVEEGQPQFDKEILISEAPISKDREEQCDSYVTKEATGTTNQRGDEICTVNCKIEQPNGVEDKSEDGKNIVYDDKKIVKQLDSLITGDSSKCCCDCHLNMSKTCSSNKKFDKGNVNEWALQCECDLKVSDGMYQMIDNYAENQCTTREAMKSGLSAILIKGRNTKFAVIK